MVGLFIVGGALGYFFPLAGASDGASGEGMTRAEQKAAYKASKGHTMDPNDLTGGKDTDGYYYLVDGKNKLPKLKRLYGDDTVLTIVVTDLDGNQLMRVDDVYHANLDLNKSLGAGEYYAKFYDANGTLLTPSQEVGDTLILK